MLSRSADATARTLPNVVVVPVPFTERLDGVPGSSGDAGAFTIFMAVEEIADVDDTTFFHRTAAPFSYSVSAVNPIVFL